MKIKSSLLTLSHEPLDAKIVNFRFNGDTIVLESIPDYLNRIKLGIRVPGIIVTIIINPDNSDTLIIAREDLDITLRNYTNKYYAFIGGIRDEDFKEIIISGGSGNNGNNGDSAYEVAVSDGFVGTKSEWLISLIGPPGSPGNDGNGNDGSNGNDGNGIVSIINTSTNGLVKTYTITFTDMSTTTFSITDGSKGDTGDTGDKGDAGLPNDEYTVLLTQTSTNNPILSVKENNIGAITCPRTSAGIYDFTSNGLFIREKTVPINDIMQDQSWNLYKLNWISVNIIRLTTYLASDISVPADNVCNDTYINFKVYK
jgi:hypothetical protein